jgi:hypothetical protein
MKIKINPYKAGIIFYITFIISVIIVTGCQTKQRNQMKQEAEDILNHPNLVTKQNDNH